MIEAPAGPPPSRWLLPAVFLALPPLVLWPLPRVGLGALLTLPSGEAAAHVWTLWAAFVERNPLGFHTRLVAWPDGVDVLPIDPANIPWVALGAPFGPAAAYNAILLGGLLLMGVAGVLLARATGGAPWLGAVAAMTCPAFLAGTLRGATEQLSVGWVGIGLALLLLALERGGWHRVVAAGAAMGACTWAGPYNGLWMAFAGLIVVAGLLFRRDGRAWRRALPAGLLALVVATPVVWSILHDFQAMRDDRMQTSALRAPVAVVGALRGGRVGVSDLLDPWVPAPFTGPFSDLSQTTYLGIVALLVAGFAALRHRPLRPWLAGAAAAVVVGLGPWLYVNGQLLQVADRPLAGPTWFLMHLPFLRGLTHWYRVAPVAGLLLVPLVAAWGRRRWAPLLAALLVADALLLAPFHWPLPATSPPGRAVLDDLPPGEAVMELPASTQPDPPVGVWRNAGPLYQIQHRHPITSTVMLLPEPRSLERARSGIKGLLSGAGLPGGVIPDLRQHGVRWLLVNTSYPSMAHPNLIARLIRCLGPPLDRRVELWLWDLDGAATGGCPPDP